ncbi:MAG: zinc-ribbon domain-containing protein [Zoogloea sp.]|nr:zinc-ribbon domain-containing protein [Zoogloea sp.]
MILARCPACSTTFRVRPEQLRARQGRVRCGQCNHAFNALEALVDEGITDPAAPAAVSPSEPALFVLEEKPPRKSQRINTSTLTTRGPPPGLKQTTWNRLPPHPWCWRGRLNPSSSSAPSSRNPPRCLRQTKTAPPPTFSVSWPRTTLRMKAPCCPSLKMAVRNQEGRFSPRSGHHGCRKSPPGST